MEVEDLYLAQSSIVKPPPDFQQLPPRALSNRTSAAACRDLPQALCILDTKLFPAESNFLRKLVGDLGGDFSDGI